MKSWSEMSKNQRYGWMGVATATAVGVYYAYTKGYFDKNKKKSVVKIERTKDSTQ